MRPAAAQDDGDEEEFEGPGEDGAPRNAEATADAYGVEPEEGDAPADELEPELEQAEKAEQAEQAEDNRSEAAETGQEKKEKAEASETVDEPQVEQPEQVPRLAQRGLRLLGFKAFRV